MKKILIIEDEADVAKTMKMLLEREGYGAEYILDAEKALPIIKSFDLVLLDIMMPKMSGREVLAEMKKRKLKVPVILVTAIGFPEPVRADLQARYPDIIVALVSKLHMRDEMLAEIKKRLK